MEKSSRRKRASAGSEAAQLRKSIDAGATHDKVDYPDPAVAPLGTDAEAGGRMASAGLVHNERVYEEEAENGLGPSHLPERGRQRGAVFLIAIGAVAAAVLVLIAVWLGLR